MLIPFFLYLAAMLMIGIWARKEVDSVRQTVETETIAEFYLARRSLGYIVLTFTLLATWASGGAFVGTPGMGYGKGFFSVLIALPAAGSTFLILGGLGKKLAIVGRKIKAVTFPAILRARFDHPAIGIVSALLVVVFLTAYMCAQFVGGARIFEALTGFPYKAGVVVTGLIIVIYAALGGFRAVTITDTVQGILMVVMPIIVYVGFLLYLGDTHISKGLMAIDPKYVTPNAGGSMSFSFIISLTWVAIGISAVGAPHLIVRGMAYKDSKTMHRAVLLGTPLYIVMAILLWVAGTVAVLIVGPGIKPGDLGFPSAVAKVFPPVVVGLMFAGPFAAIMSTVDSFLLVSASGVVEDLYVTYINPNVKMAGRLFINRIVVLVIGILVFTVALFPPPPFLQYMIWYSLGGLSSAFIFPLLAALYWPRANKYGALAGMLGGTCMYILASYFKWGRSITHSILPGMITCVVLLVVFSLITSEPSKAEIERFWGE
jgi:sodium/pantothenate symporter